MLSMLSDTEIKPQHCVYSLCCQACCEHCSSFEPNVAEHCGHGSDRYRSQAQPHKPASSRPQRASTQHCRPAVKTMGRPSGPELAHKHVCSSSLGLIENNLLGFPTLAKAPGLEPKHFDKDEHHNSLFCSSTCINAGVTMVCSCRRACLFCR